MITLRTLTPEDWRAWRELRLAALAEAPAAFSSTLAEWQGPGDTEARWRARLSNVALNLIASLDARPAGMTSGVQAGVPGDVELISMWVQPWARGRGVGDALVAAVCAWAAAQGAARVVLRAYDDNAAALALYRRQGFQATGTVELSADGAKREIVMARPTR